MPLRFIVLHVTVLLVLGFFVGFAAQKSTGRLKEFGRYLSYWLYFLAVVSTLLVIFHPGFVTGRHASMMEHSGQPAAPAPAQPSQQ